MQLWTFNELMLMTREELCDLNARLERELPRHEADAIAEFLFGSRSSRRKVYYLAECSKLPIFRLGSVLCARKSVLLEFIVGQEERVKPHVNRD